MVFRLAQVVGKRKSVVRSTHKLHYTPLWTLRDAGEFPKAFYFAGYVEANETRELINAVAADTQVIAKGGFVAPPLTGLGHIRELNDTASCGLINLASDAQRCQEHLHGLEQRLRSAGETDIASHCAVHDYAIGIEQTAQKDTNNVGQNLENRPQHILLNSLDPLET